MNYSTVKKLHGIALLLEAIALLITLLMTIGQTFVKPLALASSDINEIIAIPVSTLISVIPDLILFAISFFLIKKSNRSNNTTHVVVFTTVSIVLHALTPYIANLFIQVVARFQGAGYIASYSALTSVLSFAISPLEIVALTLFFLSLGGYYGTERKLE
ncbi:MAG: hypothetical protein IKT67_09445 [Lachnospiraceae bacterium]|nr:hypothetical protein [Lachnospiraceae bacterium]